MADGDYERGRARELDAIAAKLKRLRGGLRTGRPTTVGRVVLNAPPPQSDTKTSQRQDNSKDTDA
jgi:hypothetical protein